VFCHIRPGEARDLPGVAAIQQASPAASDWPVAEYLQYDFRVADADGPLAGFLVSRLLTEGEWEILNVAVSPLFRRRGVGRCLLHAFLETVAGEVYLEVRESNEVAIIFYKSMGFKEIGRRPQYYRTSSGEAETAIVMKFHSC